MPNISVCTIYYHSLNEKTGAGKVVACFGREELFSHFNVKNVDIYSTIFNQNVVNGNNVKKNSLKDNIKNVISNLLNKTYLGNCLKIKLQEFRHGRIAVKKYVKSSKKQYNIFVFHEIYSCYAFLKTRKSENKKTILVIHTDGELWKTTRTYYPKIVNSRFERSLIKIENFVLQRVNKIVLVSESSYAHFIEMHKSLENKTTIIRNGIDDVPITIGDLCYKKKEETFNIVIVGTINNNKNQLMMIRVMPYLLQANITLTLVGDGPLMETCQKEVEKLGITNYVFFAGRTNDVNTYLSKADLFVSTSFSEGLSIAGIEALRFGLPMVLTDVGGNNELISNNGFLIAIDKKQLVDSVLTIRNDVEIQVKMRKASRNLFLSKFSIQNMISDYCALFNKILEDNSK